MKLKTTIKSIAAIAIIATASFSLTSCEPNAITDGVKEEIFESVTGRNVDVEDGKISPAGNNRGKLSGKNHHSKSKGYR